MAQIPPAVHDAPQSSITVVVADDSAALRTLARFSLSPARGFTVVAEAASGGEVLRLTDVHAPDCVVLDIEMPGMDGLDALAELRRRWPATPVVVLSGSSDAATRDRSIAAGAAAYLNKRDDFARLGDTVRQVTSDSAEAVPATPAAEDAAAAADAAAESSQAELRRLEYVVSHDLAEPLRIMSGFATLLKDRYVGVLDDTGITFLEHIVSGTSRMQSMIDDLLTFSRAANLPARSEPVDLAATFAAVDEELRPLMTSRGAKIDFDRLPAVLADPGMLLTVLREVVINAIVFNNSSEPSIVVAGHVDDDLHRVTITIADNGIGVAPAKHDRVFDLFVRLNTREEYPGTGTGLALSRRLITLQDGTIELSSTPDDGALVTITLPAARRA